MTDRNDDNLVVLRRTFKQLPSPADPPRPSIPQTQWEDTAPVPLFSQVHRMLDILLRLQLVYFHWSADRWLLKFQFETDEHRRFVLSGRHAMKDATDRLHAFTFDKLFENAGTQTTIYIEIAAIEGFEVDEEFLNVFLRTFRHTAFNQKEANRDEPEGFWAQMTSPEQRESFRVHWMFRPVDNEGKSSMNG